MITAWAKGTASQPSSSPGTAMTKWKQPKGVDGWSAEGFVGQLNSSTTAVSIARMKSPTGWSERGQTPEFDEYMVVLRGRRTREPTRYTSLGSSRRSDRESLSMSFPNPFSVPI